VRGELGAVVRTGFVLVGFVVLLAGIVTLAYPPLLTDFVFGGGQATPSPQTGPAGVPTGTSGPTLETSMVGIVWGLTLIAAGLAIPGRAGFGVRHQSSFTRRQRWFTLVGAVLVIAVPAAVGGVIFTTNRYAIAAIPTALLAVIGGILVLVGGSNGLK
jgi:hypothetical protein